MFVNNISCEKTPLGYQETVDRSQSTRHYHQRPKLENSLASLREQISLVDYLHGDYFHTSFAISSIDYYKSPTHKGSQKHIHTYLHTHTHTEWSDVAVLWTDGQIQRWVDGEKDATLQNIKTEEGGEMRREKNKKWHCRDIFT